MPFIKLEDFSGIVPRTGPTQLQANQAQIANNLRATSQELRSWKKEVFEYKPINAAVRSIYKLYDVTTGEYEWLEWTTDVDVVSGPIGDITESRIYYTGDGIPKKSNWALATTNGLGSAPYPNSWYYIGVKAPADAPTLAATQSVTNLVLVDGGSGYTSAPTVSFSSGAALATAEISAEVTQITITNGGTGYTTAPAVTITGGGGAGAIATASIVDGVVTAVEVIQKGSGYTEAPTVTFSGGGASGTAVATATISGKVARLNLQSGGSGYSVPPTVSFTGGGGADAIAVANFEPVETRAYVYTNVSTFGDVQEESAPSPATTVDVSSTGGSVVISGFTAIPSTGYNITSRRIYRTITGSESVVYSFVTELPIATTSYTDTLSVTALGETLTSLYYEEPPEDLVGLVSMPNGILAGFRGNEVWFSEPYLPHAWPSTYMMTVGDEIVGLGVYDTSLVVLTKKNPYVITGNSPGAMSQAKLPMMQPCVSKRSIASDQYGVLYASPNGLVSIGAGTQDVVTVPLYTREEWQTLAPGNMVGKIYNNMYIGFCTVNGVNSAIVIARGDVPPLFVLAYDANALFIDHGTGSIYAVSNLDNNIYQLDADPLNNTFYEWKSKKFTMPNPMNYAAIKVQADFDYISDGTAYNALLASIIAANQATYAANSGNVRGALNWQTLNTPLVNGSLLTPLPSEATSRVINVLVYADETLLFSSGVTSPEPMRIPVGTKAYVYEITVSGNSPVRGVQMSTSINELRTLTNG